MAAPAQNSADWLGLAGRVAVVTGGGGGIGRATAVSFARAGARVAVIDRDENGLETTRSELRALGAEPVVAACDTTNMENVSAAAETIAKSLGPCGILVNTAAILRSGGLDTLSLAEWNTTLAVNPWIKFCPPTGPSSPWAKNPAKGILPTSLRIALAS